MLIGLKHIVWLWLLVLFIAPTAAAQYFNHFYDYDSTADGGNDLFVLSDSTYFILGGSLNIHTNQNADIWLNISKDGNTILNRGIVGAENVSYYNGFPGRVKVTQSGKYIIPITVQEYKSSTAMSSRGGILIVNKDFDTVLTRCYTDTAKYLEDAQDCAVVYNGSLFICGEQADTSKNSFSSSLLYCIDTSGNLKWKRAYHKITGNSERAITIIQVSNSRLVLSGNSEGLVRPSPGDYYFKGMPWFMLIDTSGKVLRDTVWTLGYSGGGNLCVDPNGGYYQWGKLDTMLTAPSDAVINFPAYLAHIDTNFNVEWLHKFSTGKFPDIRRDIIGVKSLKNGNCLIVGDLEYNYSSSGRAANRGWAIKLDKNGGVLWENTYVADTNYDAFICDAKERNDGSIVMVGAAINMALPKWHQQDIWLLSIDSNGCEMPGCSRLAVQTVPQGVTEFSVYPNPVQDVFKVNSPGKGILILYDINGRVIGRYKISEGANELKFPEVGSGIYTSRWVSDDGSCNKMIRIVKE